ncbi:MAG: alginate export family protein [Rhodospirillales bacterium]
MPYCKPRSFIVLLAFALLLPCIPGAPARSEEAPAATAYQRLIEALTKGKFNVNVRYRYEHVDQDGIGRNANANTLRTRLGYTTGAFHGFSMKVEGENVVALGADRYNSTTNGLSSYPVVADPEETEFNQVYLRYTGLKDTAITGGRQRIIFDNARFVGNVGWRQNEQTFDAAQVNFTGLPKTELSYVYLWKVNRVFSDESVNGNFRMNSHLLNASYDGFGLGKLTAYAYLLDFNRASQSGNSTQTYGLRFNGGYKINDNTKLLYALESAHQRDYADNANSINQNYYNGEVGLAFPKVMKNLSVTGKIGYEVLEGDGVQAFQTPLATLHAFNGWTDKFLTTPADGIEDLYFKLALNYRGVKVLGVYHDFNADNTDADYGTEWGVSISRKFFKRFLLGLKYADYSAESFATDTRKVWLTAQFDY